jgi:hypothetical protein
MPFLRDPNYWREQANQMRNKAASAKDNDAANVLVDLASECDRLAQGRSLCPRLSVPPKPETHSKSNSDFMACGGRARRDGSVLADVHSSRRFLRPLICAP